MKHANRHRRATTTPVRRRGLPGPPAGLGVVLAIVLIAALYALITQRSHGSTADDAVCDGCQIGVAASVAVGSTPCPYCNQDPAAWQKLTTVAPPEIAGKSLAVVEGSCGALIYGSHEYDHLPPASLTKIVTALVVMDKGRLDDRVDVKINGWDLSSDDESSIMGLEAGMQLSTEELLYGLLLPSGNDAALALADHYGGAQSFVAAMNQRLARLGLTNTAFVTPDGRDAPGHYSSALDMALLGRELMANPKLREIVATPTFLPNWNGRLLWNMNGMLQFYKGAIGVKTGYTEGADYTIVSAAQRDGRELYVAVMGSSNLYLDSIHLLNWAFANTKSPCA